MAAAGLRFRVGEVGGTPVVVVRCGIGKVAAARTAAELAHRFAPRAMVVLGTAGALASAVRVGDLVLATEGIQHDLGVREGRRATADAALRAELVATARTLVLPGSVREGTVLTGDRACVTFRRRLRLRFAFRRDRPLVVEMEGAAAGCVAASLGIPHAILRVATDRAGPFALREFRKHFPALAPIPSRVALAWLRGHALSSAPPRLA